MISKFRFLIPVLISGILAVTMQSCFDSDDYDMDKLSDKVDWTPNMIVPVSYGTYSLWYLLNEHETDPADQTIFLENGFLHIKYREDNIFTYDAGSVLTFPNQLTESYSMPLPPVGFAGPIPIPPQSDVYGVQTGQAGITLSQLEIDGNLQLTFSNPLNADISLDVTIPGGTIGGALATDNFTIPANNPNHVENFDLTDLNLTFNTPYTTANEITIEFSGSILDNGGTISGIGSLGIQYQVQNINFDMAYGDFGKQMIDIGTGNIDMDVDFWDDIEGEYEFADPRIYLYMRNSVGVPFEINANMTGYSTDGNSASLNPDPLQPNYPKNLSEVTNGISETVVYDRNNSQITQVMALPPSDRLDYSGQVDLNPNPVDINSQPNILSSNSRIDVDLEIDVPLDFSATNLMLRDTIDDMDIDDAEKIMNAAIVITAENGYPLNVQIDRIYMTDELYNVIDSIVDSEVVDAAGVYPTGHASEGEVDPSTIVEVTHEIKLSQTQIEHLNETENLIINASVKTSGTGTEAVKLKGDYELKFAIAVQAQIDLNN